MNGKCKGQAAKDENTDLFMPIILSIFCSTVSFVQIWCSGRGVTQYHLMAVHAYTFFTLPHPFTSPSLLTLTSQPHHTSVPVTISQLTHLSLISTSPHTVLPHFHHTFTPQPNHTSTPLTLTMHPHPSPHIHTSHPHHTPTPLTLTST